MVGGQAPAQPQEVVQYGQGGHWFFMPAMREPLCLPLDNVELPAPEIPPSPPSLSNPFTTILPPIMLVIGTAVISLLSNNWTMMGPMLIMSMAFPLANILSYAVQKRTYRRAWAEYEASYRKKLAKMRRHLDSLAENQRAQLEKEYPTVSKMVSIVLDRNKHLWWRRADDEDFLALRIGTGDSKPSFSVSPPRTADSNNPLTSLAWELSRSYQKLPHLPVLLPLQQVGSLAIAGKPSSAVYGVARRLVLDVLVHHSPEDVQLVVMTDLPEGRERWEWLKWAPHTSAIHAEEGVCRLAFTMDQAQACLEWLREQYRTRFPTTDTTSNVMKEERQPAAIIVLLDDSGRIRQHPDIANLAARGKEAGIYLLFIGGQGWPRECRARLDVLREHNFHYLSSRADKESLTTCEGMYETASLEDCECIARSLAPLKVSTGQSVCTLPDSIRISQVLGTFSLEALKQNWMAELSPADMLQLPVGVRVGHEGLEPMIIDLRPEGLGGYQAFHSVLIGTTGSGKSVFLQTLILSAAYRYSPRWLNFMLMDFKAGASELSKLEKLPHVVGLVTDLTPELATRALIAVDSEIRRRKQAFDEAGKCTGIRISDIWDYNKRFPGDPLPHLLLVLDEFAKGIELLPDLQRVLQSLAQQGRALGVYLILANQRVTHAVDTLLSNIGWRIVLPVAERDEMRIVDRLRSPSTRPGRGYVRVKEEVYEFQGARSDEATLSPDADGVGSFTIYTIEADGSWKTLYKYSTNIPQEDRSEQTSARKSELETLIDWMKQAEQDLGLVPARRIYLPPLEEHIRFEEMLEDSSLPLRFEDGRWQGDSQISSKLLVPLGYVDLLDESRQEILMVNFEEQDGHLWIVGSPGSGKAMSLITLLLSLAYTHTPEEVQFYILEYGAGTLLSLVDLPHTGAVLRLEEKERLQRLLAYLDKEMEQRRIHLGGQKVDGAFPSIFLVVNDFAELRANYPDEAEQVASYVRSGKAVGIHVIITSNRGTELSRSISGNIARRLVLQLTSRNEYLDVVNQPLTPLPKPVQGRGYWIDRGVRECQVAQPPCDMKNLVQLMRKTWRGALPHEIRALPSCISLASLLDAVKPIPGNVIPIAVGLAYEDLRLITPNLLEEIPQWLILGPRESGKSNFLACMARSVLHADANGWEVWIFSPRRSLANLVNINQAKLFSTIEESVKALEELNGRLNQGQPAASGKRLLLLLDDLGSFFQSGRERAAAALNTLTTAIEKTNEVYLVAAGLVEELRLQMGNALIRLLRQSRTGVVFSKDSNDLDWLGAQVSWEYRKMDLPCGRGFFVSKGKAQLVQTPLTGECPK
nr:hypothetical protein [Chloroflexota bacterium]